MTKRQGGRWRGEHPAQALPDGDAPSVVLLEAGNTGARVRSVGKMPRRLGRNPYLCLPQIVGKGGNDAARHKSCLCVVRIRVSDAPVQSAVHSGNLQDRRKSLYSLRANSASADSQRKARNPQAEFHRCIGESTQLFVRLSPAGSLDGRGQSRDLLGSPWGF